MSMKTYEDLKDILCRELDEISRRGDIDREGLDNVYKLTSAITMIESLMNKDEYSNERGYSNVYGRPMTIRMSRMYDPYSRDNYSRGMSNDYSEARGRGASYDDYSEARGRDAMTGRFVSRDNDPGYSRHTAEQKVTHKLEDMLDTTQDQRIRDALTQAINMLK